MVKNLPARQEIRVCSLGQGDPLEKGIATHSNILAWKIPWTKKPGGLQSRGSQRVRHYRVTNTFTFLSLKMLRSWIGSSLGKPKVLFPGGTALKNQLNGLFESCVRTFGWNYAVGWLS